MHDFASALSCPVLSWVGYQQVPACFSYMEQIHVGGHAVLTKDLAYDDAETGGYPGMIMNVARDRK